MFDWVPLLVAIIYLGLGGGGLIITSRMLVKSRKRYRGWTRTDANILGLDKRYFDDAWVYTIEFETAEGKRFEGKCSTLERVDGGSLPIHYDPSNPDEFASQTVWADWTGPILSLGMSILFFILGLDRIATGILERFFSV